MGGDGFSARRLIPRLKYNGKNVTESLGGYLESISYTDVARGESDHITIRVHNIGMEWLGKWAPKKGDTISADFAFRDWNYKDDDFHIKADKFTVDEVSYYGKARQAEISAVAVPSNDSFRTRERSKTWKKITVHRIASEIAAKYKIKLLYSAGNVQIEALEQSSETDCSFLFKLCEKYGFSMKFHNGAIVIYDQAEMEAKKAVATLHPESFLDEDYTLVDSLDRVYTGARIAYKTVKKTKEKASVYVGYKAEDAKGARVLKLEEGADSAGEAKWIAAAKVNASNENATTLEGRVFPDKKLAAGVTVSVKGFGHCDGKYFIDEMELSVDDGKTEQHLSMHKCQKRIKRK